MEYSEYLLNQMEELKIKNDQYNALLTEISDLKEKVDLAKKNKEMDLSRNTLNYRVKCAITLLLELLINLNGIEDLVALIFIILFAVELFKKQKVVRDNIVKLEKEYEEKFKSKDEIYEELCKTRSLVHERKREEDRTYVICDNQNIVYDNVVALSKRLY